jgi:hypothetical protein
VIVQPRLLFMLILLLMSVLQGCTAFEGSELTLDTRGPHSLQQRNYVADQSSFQPGELGTFERSYTVALSDAQSISAGKSTAPTSSTDPVSIHARQMAIDGVHLVDGYCADFFRTGGNNQKWLLVAKDLTGALGTLATGAVALASPANTTPAAVVALTTGAAYNGADIYTRNFLFGTDNIESVRTLTMNTLASHRDAALPQNDTSVWSFGGASEVVDDHQEMCMPAYIRSLVLDAIKSGKATPFTASGGTTGGSGLPTPQAAAAAVVPAATNAAAAAAPTAAAGAAPAAQAAANAAAPAAAAAAAVPGATPAKVSAAAANAAAPAAHAAAAAAAPAASAAAINTVANTAANIVAPAAAAAATTGAIATGAQPASRHVTMRIVN